MGPHRPGRDSTFARISAKRPRPSRKRAEPATPVFPGMISIPIRASQTSDGGDLPARTHLFDAQGEALR